MKKLVVETTTNQVYAHKFLQGLISFPYIQNDVSVSYYLGSFFQKTMLQLNLAWELTLSNVVSHVGSWNS